MATRSCLIIISFLFLTVSSVLAEQVTFIKEYNYQASELDSKTSSRTIAMEQVKRLLLEELGSFLVSKTEVKDFQLTKDQITSMTSGMVKTIILDEKWDGKTYYMKAKVMADPKEIAESVDKIRNDREKNEELDETRRKTEEALDEVDRLRKELQVMKADKNRQEAYRKAVDSLSAGDWLDKGNAFMSSGDYQKAIDAFNRALEANPQLPRAYLFRAVAYMRMGRKDLTIADCSRALAMNPRMPQAYLHRGMAYLASGRPDKAIGDFDDALALNAKMPRAYFFRGVAYMKLGDRRKGIEDIKIAAGMNFDKAQEFLRSRGISLNEPAGEKFR